MSSLSVGSGMRHEYRIKGWLRGLYLAFGLIVGGGGVLVIYLAATQPAVRPMLFMALFLFPFSAYMIALAVRSKLAIDGPRIEVTSALRVRSADQSEVEGFRTVRSQNGTFYRLILKNGRRSFSIPRMFDGEDELFAWLGKLTNLDKRDRVAVLHEIAENAELGSTPEDRLAAVGRARKVSLGLTSVSIVAAVGLYFAPASYALALALLLAAAPMVVVVLLFQQPLLYGLVKRTRDPRAETALVFMAAGFGLMLRNLTLEFLSFQPLILAILLLWLGWAAVLIRPSLRGSKPWVAMIFSLVFSGLLSFGMVTAADTIHDPSQASVFTTQVTGKQVSGGRSTTYYLVVAPWGPMEGTSKISVSATRYGNTAIDDQVCVGLHAGNLHAPWYALVDCPTESEPPLQP
jgi:hypothetical protein